MKSLFSFQGRLSREQYFKKCIWRLIFLGFFILSILLISPVIDLLGNLTGPYGTGSGGDGGLGLFLLGGFLFLTICFIFLVLVVALIVPITVMRFHDRDKSGWWVLIFFIPFIGAIWLLVECGCLQGTTGPNRFGSDPLDPLEDTGNGAPAATIPTETAQMMSGS